MLRLLTLSLGALVMMAKVTTSAVAVVEGEMVRYELCPGADDENPGPNAKVEYGTGFDWKGTYDCIILTDDGSIQIYRFIPALRRVVKVQALLPAGDTDTTGTHWWKKTPSVGTLPVLITSNGIAVGEEGRAVFVTTRAPGGLVVFDRGLESGHLSFREMRKFLSEQERAEFLHEMRKVWSTTRVSRERRWDQEPR